VRGATAPSGFAESDVVAVGNAGDWATGFETGEVAFALGFEVATGTGLIGARPDGIGASATAPCGFCGISATAPSSFFTATSAVAAPSSFAGGDEGRPLA